MFAVGQNPFPQFVLVIVVYSGCEYTLILGALPVVRRKRPGIHWVNDGVWFDSGGNHKRLSVGVVALRSAIFLSATCSHLVADSEFATSLRHTTQRDGASGGQIAPLSEFRMWMRR